MTGQSNQTEIFQYIKKKNQKVGFLYAYCDDDCFYIGYSLCNLKHDKFDETLGYKIAQGRAKTQKNFQIPHSIKDNYEKFIKRCKRYFKGKKQCRM